MARELQSQVKRPKWRTIDSLAWSERQPWYSAGFKRKGLGKPMALLLCGDLRGELETEEWRTLLTYYFLNLKVASRLFLEFFGLSVGAIMLLILGGLVTSLMYGIQGGALYAQFVAGPGSLIVLILIFPTARRLQLRQDKIVARSIGLEAF